MAALLLPSALMKTSWSKTAFQLQLAQLRRACSPLLAFSPATAGCQLQLHSESHAVLQPTGRQLTPTGGSSRTQSSGLGACQHAERSCSLNMLSYKTTLLNGRCCAAVLNAHQLTAQAVILLVIPTQLHHQTLKASYTRLLVTCLVHLFTICCPDVGVCAAPHVASMT